MISKNQLKYYSSLKIKKFREQEKKFLVEGIKNVLEGINSDYNCEIIFYTHDFFNSNKALIEEISSKGLKIEVLKSLEFQKIAETKSPQGITAVFFSKNRPFEISKFNESVLVYMDNISDPGNMGTIIRTCDWFGVKNIITSNDSVEYLNSKVVRSSMGSIFHLNIFLDEKDNLLKSLKNAGYRIICADLNGKDIFKYTFAKKMVLILSNESTGPTEKVRNFADDFISIPSYGKAESLNVASAAAVMLAQIKQSQMN